MWELACKTKSLPFQILVTTYFSTLQMQHCNMGVSSKFLFSAPFVLEGVDWLSLAAGLLIMNTITVTAEQTAATRSHKHTCSAPPANHYIIARAINMQKGGLELMLSNSCSLAELEADKERNPLALQSL